MKKTRIGGARVAAAIAALGALVGAAALCAGIAAAEEAEAPELSRAEYVQRAEPICRAQTRASNRILRGVKGQVRHNRLRPAGRRFLRAARAQAAGLRRLIHLPRPEADRTRLTRWLGLLRAERGVVAKIGRALLRANRRAAHTLQLRLQRTANRANNAVLGFGFHACHIDTARLT